VPESLIDEIVARRPVTYEAITKKLQRRKIPTRISELGDYYGTFMIRHGIVAQEADLFCWRILPNIFVRHYFSPPIKELRERTLKALEEMAVKGLQ
jgi:hypothetical protein